MHQCILCGHAFSFQWTDSHGIAVCRTCGLPYRLYHYEEVNGKDQRVDKPPECIILDASMPLARAYWADQRKMVFPGICDMGILSGRDSTYSGARLSDFENWAKWCEEHPELMP